MSSEKAKLTPEIIMATKGIETVEILAEILKGQNLIVPKGVVENPGPFTITYANPQRIKCLPTWWFSFSLFNDGPQSMWVLVEGTSEEVLEPPRPHEVLNGESYNVDMGSPLIRGIYLYCANPGDSATVRISGVR